MIFLEIGQAGIQIGQSLFDIIEQEFLYLTRNLDSFCNYPFSLFKQICIDTERKVWKKRSRGSTKFNSIYLDHGSTGRGNNWAHGFFDDSILDDVMEVYRKVLESSFRYDGCMMMHRYELLSSIAGGTGSGLGSRLLTEIRDQYGKGPILTSSFAPFASGETSVQNYNALLTLNSLASNSDFIGYFSNDQLLKCAQRNMSLSNHSQKQDVVPLEALNQYAARCLAGIMLPKTTIANFKGKANFGRNIVRFDPNELIYAMTPMPTYRFCQYATSTAPDKRRNLDSWEDIMTELLRNIPHDENRACFAGKLVVRGAQGPDIWKKLPKMTERWKTKVGAPISILEPDIEVSYLYGLDPNDSKRTLETCFNSKSILLELDPILHKAELLYKQKAYLHWYQKYCPDIEAYFDDAFERLYDIRDAYQSLSGF